MSLSSGLSDDSSWLGSGSGYLAGVLQHLCCVGYQEAHDVSVSYINVDSVVKVESDSSPTVKSLSFYLQLQSLCGEAF